MRILLRRPCKKLLHFLAQKRMLMQARVLGQQSLGGLLRLLQEQHIGRKIGDLKLGQPMLPVPKKIPWAAQL